jgi:hypothetical protein
MFKDYRTLEIELPDGVKIRYEMLTLNRESLLYELPITIGTAIAKAMPYYETKPQTNKYHEMWKQIVKQIRKIVGF